MSNDSNISYFEADIFKVFGENPELAEVQDDELEDSGPRGMNLGARIVWDVLFGGMLFVAVVGNLIVLWIVMGKPFYYHESCCFPGNRKGSNGTAVKKTFVLLSCFSVKLRQFLFYLVQDIII